MLAARRARLYLPPVRAAILAIGLAFAAGCGAGDAALVDVEVRGGPALRDAFTDLRAHFTLEGSAPVDRGIFWDGGDPFVFRVRLPFAGAGHVAVDAIEVAPDGSDDVVGSGEADVTYAFGADAPTQAIVELRDL